MADMETHLASKLAPDGTRWHPEQVAQHLLANAQRYGHCRLLRFEYEWDPEAPGAGVLRRVGVPLI